MRIHKDNTISVPIEGHPDIRFLFKDDAAANSG
jgi:hypothetical protein